MKSSLREFMENKDAFVSSAVANINAKAKRKRIMRIIFWAIALAILAYVVATAHCREPLGKPEPVRTVCDCEVTRECTCYEGECACPACTQTALKETLAKLDRVTAILDNLEKRIAALEAKTATVQTSPLPVQQAQPVQYHTYGQPVYAPLFGTPVMNGQSFGFGGNCAGGVCFGGT